MSSLFLVVIARRQLDSVSNECYKALPVVGYQASTTGNMAQQELTMTSGRQRARYMDGHTTKSIPTTPRPSTASNMVSLSTTPYTILFSKFNLFFQLNRQRHGMEAA